MTDRADEETCARLEDAAALLAAMVERRARADASELEVLRAMEEAFALRDRVERAAIARGSPRREPHEEVAVMVFERLVRPLVFRLTEQNERRRAGAAAIDERHRASFWWWHEGVEIAPHASPALPAVAHLIARFPAAAEALASLVAAQRAWDEAGASRRRGGEVVSLRAWVAARSRAQRPPGIALAAATAEEEVTLIDEARYQVSFAPSGALVIDLVADRALGETPYLRLADGAEIRATAVPHAEERFALSIPESAWNQGRAVLVLPLSQGTIEISLPPERP